MVVLVSKNLTLPDSSLRGQMSFEDSLHVKKKEVSDRVSPFRVSNLFQGI